MLEKARKHLKKQGYSETRIDRNGVVTKKDNRGVYGAIYKHPNGDQFYMAWRRSHDIFRNGEKTISDAIRKGVATWAIDSDTLRLLRLRGVTRVGILNRDENESYWADMDVWQAAALKNFERRGGAEQRYLPFHAFSERRAFLV